MTKINDKKLGAPMRRTATGFVITPEKSHWRFHVNPTTKQITQWRRTTKKVNGKVEETFWLTYMYKVT